MARKRMITRTIEQTTVLVMTLDISTAEVKINEYTIGGTYENDIELLNNLKKIFETEAIKLVHIESKKVQELLLGMEEDDFIRLAKVLPPRTTSKNEKDGE